MKRKVNGAYLVVRFKNSFVNLKKKKKVVCLIKKCLFGKVFYKILWWVFLQLRDGLSPATLWPKGSG